MRRGSAIAGAVVAIVVVAFVLRPRSVATLDAPGAIVRPLVERADHVAADADTTKRYVRCLDALRRQSPPLRAPTVEHDGPLPPECEGMTVERERLRQVEGSSFESFELAIAWPKR